MAHTDTVLSRFSTSLLSKFSLSRAWTSPPPLSLFSHIQSASLTSVARLVQEENSSGGENGPRLRRRARPPSLSPPSSSLLILTHRGSQLGVTGALTPANQTAREAFPDMPL
ncbi:hypothetical protein QQF64_007250 [Cirrhinus molitorella]|uniref:Uncharacterized protein n=1 Tax=Cirrhinus molitorella TaxID=172907 RepID=A0ABR3MBK1_9TELE